MKVVLLHPPFYLTNYSLYHELGKLVELTCYIFGDTPAEHPAWKLQQYYRPEQHSFRVRQLGTGSYPKKQIYSGAFLRHLRDDRPDAVITLAFAPYGFYAALCKKLLGYCLFLMTDANHVSDSGISPVKRLSRKLLLRLCDGALSASPATSDYLHFLAPRLPLHLAIYTIDIEFFQQQSAPYWQLSRTQLRQCLLQKIAQLQEKDKELSPGRELSPDWQQAPLILGVGRFVPGKNWQEGLEYLKQLPELHYLLVGSGPERELYLERARQLGVEQRFLILPFAEPGELPLYYCASDLFYFPSQSETFGFVLAEALACGLPSLCTTGAGARILIEEGQTGWYYLLGQPPASAALREYCRAAQAPAMKEYCRSFMKEHTNLQRARKILSALSS